MRLLSPSGVRFSVSDEKGERLLRQGYKRLDGAASAAPSGPSQKAAVKAPESAPKRRPRSPKATTPVND